MASKKKTVRVQFTFIDGYADKLARANDTPFYTDSQYLMILIDRDLEAKGLQAPTIDPAKTAITTQPTPQTASIATKKETQDTDDSWRLMPGYEHPSETRDKQHTPKDVDAGVWQHLHDTIDD